MSYGLYPELFEKTEKDIDHGLYEQAAGRLQSIEPGSLSKEQKIFVCILSADILSHQGKFTEALTLQRDIIKKPHGSLRLREAVFHSHAFTLGYSGNHEASAQFFAKAQKTALKLKDTSRFFASIIGSIDIEFHDYDFNRFHAPDNKSLLKRIQDALQKLEGVDDLEKRHKHLGMLSFRKAMLLWLNGNYREAKPLFEVTRQYSTTFFHTWALFGIINCLHSRGEHRELAKYTIELEEKRNKTAWHKNAMKYWPVALLLGRTWELLGQNEKAHKFYRDILLTVRNGYTNQKIVTADYASFITNYFYPVYHETVKHYLEESHEYRYALNRAEMFRARFLTEEYKKHHGIKRANQILTPNFKVNEIGAQLLKAFDGSVTVLYCFDFGDSGMLLLSRDLKEKFQPFYIEHADYMKLASLTGLKLYTKDILHMMSEILKKVLAAVGTKRLIIIPHGLFNGVPFHALFRADGPLLRNTIVNYWPSLQMAALGEGNTLSIPCSVLFVGTRTEPASAEAIASASLLPQKSCRLYDPQFSALKEKLNSGFGIAHFVAHGALRPGEDDLTIIKFKWGDLKHSKFMSSLIIKMPPVVAFNVCYSGHTLYDAADFLKGLPVTLFQKGAKTLLVSTHEVEQKPSILFYERFYKNLFSGFSLGKAYRKAILDADDVETMLANAPYIMGTGDIKISFD